MAEPGGGNGIAAPPTIGGGGIGIAVYVGGIGAWVTTGGHGMAPPNVGTGGNLTSNKGGVTLDGLFVSTFFSSSFFSI